jgi:type II secretory pathway pseudopilin PulG
MAVVAAIIGFLSTTLIINFSRTRIDIDQSANLVMSTIRQAQTKAVASATFNGYNPCGYGVHYVSPTQIAIYAGPNATTTDCSGINKNYQIVEDTIIQTQSFTDSEIQFTGGFDDIFFQPPDPKTFLNDNASLNQAPIGIQVGPTGGACPTNCKTIYVYPSGKIESQ